jgi:hypothetical protein
MKFDQNIVNRFKRYLGLNYNSKFNNNYSNRAVGNFLYGLLTYEEDRLKNYKVDFISKKKGFRKILKPETKLKIIQKLILHEYLEKFNVSDYAMGFVKNRGIISNCEKHVGKEKILKVDLKNFFDSISEEKIKKSLYELAPKSSEFDLVYLDIITYICTVDNYLPTGSPASPYLSNLVAFRLDIRLNNFCMPREISYTRYADDLIFSGNAINQTFYLKIKEIIEDEDFILNEEKTKFLFKGNKKKVTGFIINEEISIGRKEFKKLLFQLNYCRFYSFEKVIQRFDLNIKPKSLKFYFLGKISLNSKKESYFNKLMGIFRKINWENNFKTYDGISYDKKKYKRFSSKIENIIIKKREFPYLNNLNLWLDNFEEKEIPVILKLLENMHFYRLSDFQKFISDSFLSYIKDLRTPFSVIKTTTRVTNLGGSSSSSAFLLKQIKVVLGSTGSVQIVENKNLVKSISKDDNLILIDDFIGTGDSFIKEFEILNKKFNLFSKFKLITLIVPIITIEGLTRINKEFLNLKVIYNVLLREEEHYHNSKNFNQEEKMIIENLCAKHYSKDIKRGGYINIKSMLNVIFEHNSPNNSIPIYWSKGDHGIFNSLFPRYQNKFK